MAEAEKGGNWVAEMCASDAFMLSDGDRVEYAFIGRGKEVLGGGFGFGGVGLAMGGLVIGSGC